MYPYKASPSLRRLLNYLEKPFHPSGQGCL